MFATIIAVTLMGGLPGEPMLIAEDVTHVKVYYEAGRFGGWPANHGIWSWGNEILVGYSRGYYQDLGATRHHINRDKPEEFWLARSVDGGVTWTHEDPAEKGFLIPRGESLHGTETPGLDLPPIKDLKETIDFTHPDFTFTLRMENVNAGTSRFEHSYDRGKTWTQENDPVEYLGEGNPPMLNKLQDGRLCLTYGFRAYPYSIRARLSSDNGKTWGPQIILRDDGVDRDIGYVRSVERLDGKMVTTYYISDEETGPERYIGATIWDPNKVSKITSGNLQ